MDRQKNIENMGMLLRYLGYSVQFLMLTDKALGDEILNTAISYLLRIKNKKPEEYEVLDFDIQLK